MDYEEAIVTEYDHTQLSYHVEWRYLSEFLMAPLSQKERKGKEGKGEEKKGKEKKRRKNKRREMKNREENRREKKKKEETEGLKKRSRWQQNNSKKK